MADDPKSRLDDLQARIEKARGTSRDAPERGAPVPPGGLAVALRLSTELVAGVVVGAGLGYFFDRAVGTTPFGLIVFTMIGFGAGTTNLIRAASRRTEPPTKPPQTRAGG